MMLRRSQKKKRNNPSKCAKLAIARKFYLETIFNVYSYIKITLT